MPYIGNSPGTGTRNRFIYTATASQTTFSGADDNGKTLKYSDGDYIDVYLNGICLVPVTDYTATSKTSVVLIQAASLNDTLEVVAYDIATISDTVSKADGGQFDGAVTVNANFSVDNGTIKLDGNFPTGTNNVALGNAALDDASLSGNNNTAIGKDALTANTSGGQNSAVGANALQSNTTASNNTAFGTNVLQSNTTGDSLVGIGYQALNSNDTAGNNTAVGYQAGYTTVTGDSNTFVGQQAGYATVGNRNTFVGRLAGNASNLAATQQNTFIGTFSGRYVTSGAKNTILGAYDGNQSSLDIRTSSNNIVLSDGDGNPRMRFDNGLLQWMLEDGVNIGVRKNSSVVDVSSGAAVVDFDTLGNSQSKRGFYLVTVVREGGSVGTHGVFLIATSSSSLAIIYETIVKSANLSASISGTILTVTASGCNVYCNVIPIGTQGGTS